MRSLPLAALVLACLLASPEPAAAQAQSGPLCGDRDALLAELSQRYAERRAAVALTSVGHMVEVFASSDGTWTLVLTQPGGPSCVAAAGEHWQVLPIRADKPTI